MPYTPRFIHGAGTITAVRVFAWLELIASVAVSVYAGNQWISAKSAQGAAPQAQEFRYTADSLAGSIERARAQMQAGVLGSPSPSTWLELGVGVLVGGAFTCALLLLLASMAENMAVMRAAQVEHLEAQRALLARVTGAA